ncbi:MAG: peroxiredoxin-like family protein [Nitrospinales bacterium]
MSLTQKLVELKNQMAEKIPSNVRKVMGEAMEKLVQSKIAERALKEGDKAPEFALPDAEGRTVRSAELLARGPLVISFFRGSWCPYCSLELQAFQEALSDIRSMGAALVAISPQVPGKSLETKTTCNLDFEMLSDAGNGAAKQFGLVFQVPENLRPLYKSFGIDLPEYNGEASFELPLAATYVVDSAGMIRKAFVDADYSKRLDPADVVEVLKTLQVRH